MLLLYINNWNTFFGKMKEEMKTSTRKQIIICFSCARYCYMVSSNAEYYILQNVPLWPIRFWLIIMKINKLVSLYSDLPIWKKLGMTGSRSGNNGFDWSFGTSTYCNTPSIAVRWDFNWTIDKFEFTMTKCVYFDSILVVSRIGSFELSEWCRRS